MTLTKRSIGVKTSAENRGAKVMIQTDTTRNRGGLGYIAVPLTVTSEMFVPNGDTPIEGAEYTRTRSDRCQPAKHWCFDES